ncbi:MAG: hypothetical protein B5M53_04040 [Candidatus Cloacimonas sp. 4484_209]|nr:MAG: hypothetical protein B5M53_04040 [Candidatus Cloacimonas sp. 4484_209]
METLWEKVKKGFILAAERTDEFTKIGKLRIDIAGIHRKIKQNFEELGGKVYAQLKSGKRKKAIEDNADVKRLVDEIKELEKELIKTEKEINEIINK